jgi:hypothetical protein
VKADSPYRVEGTWEKMRLTMEWEVRKYFVLEADKESKPLITVCSEVLGFRPTVSYTDGDGKHYTEWHMGGSHAERLREVQGNPAYRSVKKYR